MVGHRPRHVHRVRRGDRVDRAVPGLLRPGGHRPRRLRAAQRPGGRAARPRARPALEDRQAGRRRDAAAPPLGRLPAGGAGSQLPLLRAPLRARQFAQPVHPRAGRGAPGRSGAGDALLPAGDGDRSRRQHGERGGRRPRRRPGRPLAGRGLRFRRPPPHRRRTRASPQPAAPLGRPLDAVQVAGPDT